MANLYIGQMKDILKNYHRQQGEYNKMIAENDRRFSPEYADTENFKVKEQQKQAYNSAVAKITAIYEDARKLLAKSDFLNVEALTADRLFFQDNSGFELSPSEVKGFVERYQNNPTMLKLIKSYVTKHGQPSKEHPVGKYAGVQITLPEDQVKVYQQFGEGALRVAKKIYNNGPIMQNPVEIDCFGDENFGKELYKTIGNGMELSDYSSARIPDSASHAFDGIQLKDSDSNTYIQ